jgi:hypothetical protein
LEVGKEEGSSEFALRQSRLPNLEQTRPSIMPR